MTPNPDPGVDHSGFQKAAKSTLASLAEMYAECYAEAPDSPLCQAIQDVQKAVAEIHAQKVGGMNQAEPQNFDEAAAQMHAMTMADAQAAPPQGVPA